MKTVAIFVQGFILAAAMCAITFGVVAFRNGYPAILAWLDHAHLPTFGLALFGVCLVFAAVWTALNRRRA